MDTIMVIKLKESERRNLMVFLTGKQRMQLTGDEAFEFVNICNKIGQAKPEEEVKEVKEE
jgi:hypothetical protein